MREPFYGVQENHVHTERACGIINTLATIYRQRGDIEACEPVLDLGGKLIERYERAASVINDAMTRKCCGDLTYKYNLIPLGGYSHLQFLNTTHLYIPLGGHLQFPNATWWLQPLAIPKYHSVATATWWLQPLAIQDSLQICKALSRNMDAQPRGRAYGVRKTLYTGSETLN